jgi:hypothetical protein
MTVGGVNAASPLDPSLAPDDVSLDSAPAPAASTAGNSAASGLPDRSTVLSNLGTLPPDEPDDNALRNHIAFFAAPGSDELTLDSVKQGLVQLGFSTGEAAIGAHVFFDPLPTHNVDEIVNLSEARHPDSGSFQKDGKFDEAAFQKWFGATDTDHDGQLSRLELMRGTLKLTDGPKTFISSMVELQGMFSVLSKQGPVDEQTVHDFFTGDFMAKLRAERQS